MNTSETVEQTKKTPFEMGAKKEETTDQIEQAHQEVSDSKSIYLGGKKFNSVDELAKYTEQLERERIVASTQSNQPVETVTEKKVSDLLFEDPEKALQLHEQRIIKKLKEEEAIKQNEKNFWDGFYSKNKDLSDDQDLVQFAMNKHWDELRSLHPDQAAERLADYTRKTAVRFRRAPQERTELPSGQAKVAPVSSYSSPQIQETKAAPVDFVTQLKKIQSKRK